MKLKYFALIAAAAIFIALVLISCSSDTTVLPSSEEISRFVGRAVCVQCHSDIDTEYSNQAHGLNFHTAHGLDLITGFGGSCAPCHTTGYNEPTGYVKDGTTVYLEGIGCEECHGKGSMHAASPSTKNIKRIPNAEETCWVCHVSYFLGDDYKIDVLDLGVEAVTDLDLEGKIPSSVAVHHPQTFVLLGLYGYNRNDEPGAHRYVDNTCTTCHLFSGSPESGNHDAEALEVDLESCVACHTSQDVALARMESLQEDIIEMLIEIGGEDPENPGHPDEEGSGGLMGAFVTANGINISANDNPEDSAVKAYKAARHNYELALIDKSFGVHNPDFVENLLEDAIGLLSE